jgi:hypothetical protein
MLPMQKIRYNPAIIHTSRVKSKFNKWDFWFKVVTTIGAFITVVSLIAGAVWSAKEYFDKRSQELQEKKRQYEFSLYKERKETLYPLCNAAAQIVSSRSLQEAQSAIKTFQTLYYGEVGIIADGQIAEVIKSFAESLINYQQGPVEAGPPLDLIAGASRLAVKCKEVLDLEKVYGIARN